MAFSCQATALKDSIPHLKLYVKTSKGETLSVVSDKYLLCTNIGCFKHEISKSMVTWPEGGPDSAAVQKRHEEDKVFWSDKELIFEGKILMDNSYLNCYNIQDKSTIHIVTRTYRVNPDEKIGKPSGEKAYKEIGKLEPASGAKGSGKKVDQRHAHTPRSSSKPRSSTPRASSKPRSSTPRASSKPDSSGRRSSKSGSHVCVVCKDHRPNACLAPCGHTNVCMDCADRLYPKRCPTCSEKITAVIKMVGS